MERDRKEIRKTRLEAFKAAFVSENLQQLLFVHYVTDKLWTALG